METFGYVSLGVAIVALGGGIALFVREIPSIARYIRIHRM
jgi:hypothetical protein